MGYPALQRFIAMRDYLPMLKALITDCLEQPNREWKPRHRDTEHFFISTRELARKHGDISSKHNEWAYAIRIFASIGLLFVKRPTERTAKTAREREAVERAKQAVKKETKKAFGTLSAEFEAYSRYNPVSFYWLEEYTTQRLKKADVMIKRWIDKPWNRKKKLEKADIISLWGKPVADRVFGDQRGIAAPRQEIVDIMADVLEELLKTAPYTTKQAFIKAYGYGGEAVWINNSKIVFDQMGLDYYQPNKADRERYHIPMQSTAWILVRKEFASI